MSNRSFGVMRGFKAREQSIGEHSHEEAQLTFAASGSVQVHTPVGRWLVPPQLAVFIPAGVVHRAEILSDAELWIVHWAVPVIRDWGPANLPDRAFALHVTPLLRKLLEAASDSQAAPERTELVLRLMLHEMTNVAEAPTFLPIPTSAIGRRIAEVALLDPANHLDVDELASRTATSVRTLSRVFPTETGLTFKSWRQRARIVSAIDKLAHGQSIAAASASTGFSSTASFSAAFRQVTGMTPSRFIEMGGPPQR
nr:helix-turn-helix transcriptional regulator [uncultured Devosia sp.]